MPGEFVSYERPEICICAAIRLANGEIVRGQRHDSCFYTLWRRSANQNKTWQGAEQGFMTSHNRFVGRAEAMQLQRAAGIPSAMTGSDLRGDILFSEDLY